MIRMQRTRDGKTETEMVDETKVELVGMYIGWGFVQVNDDPVPVVADPVPSAGPFGFSSYFPSGVTRTTTGSLPINAANPLSGNTTGSAPKKQSTSIKQDWVDDTHDQSKLTVKIDLSKLSSALADVVAKLKAHELDTFNLLREGQTAFDQQLFSAFALGTQSLDNGRRVYGNVRNPRDWMRIDEIDWADERSNLTLEKFGRMTDRLALENQASALGVPLDMLTGEQNRHTIDKMMDECRKNERRAMLYGDWTGLSAKEEGRRIRSLMDEDRAREQQSLYTGQDSWMTGIKRAPWDADVEADHKHKPVGALLNEEIARKRLEFMRKQVADDRMAAHLAMLEGEAPAPDITDRLKAAAAYEMAHPGAFDPFRYGPIPDRRPTVQEVIDRANGNVPPVAPQQPYVEHNTGYRLMPAEQDIIAQSREWPDAKNQHVFGYSLGAHRNRLEERMRMVADRRQHRRIMGAEMPLSDADRMPGMDDYLAALQQLSDEWDRNNHVATPDTDS